MINVDKIYAIVLPERKDSIVHELCSHNIEHVVFNAIIHDSGIAGLQLSVKKVFTEALDWGFKNVIIIEDDVEVEVDNAPNLINKCISQLPFDYDCLQFGVNLVMPPKKYSENLYKVSYSHATHASLYSAKAMKHILSVLDEKTHLDALIHKYLQPLGKSFCSNPMIFNQKDGYSFIEKRHTRYGSMMKQKYEQMTKGI